MSSSKMAKSEDKQRILSPCLGISWVVLAYDKKWSLLARYLVGLPSISIAGVKVNVAA